MLRGRGHHVFGHPGHLADQARVLGLADVLQLAQQRQVERQAARVHPHVEQEHLPLHLGQQRQRPVELVQQLGIAAGAVRHRHLLMGRELTLSPLDAAMIRCRSAARPGSLAGFSPSLRAACSRLAGTR